MSSCKAIRRAYIVLQTTQPETVQGLRNIVRSLKSLGIKPKDPKPVEPESTVKIKRRRTKKQDA